MKTKRRTILQEIGEKTFFNFYFLSGENEYKMKETIHSLKEAILTPSFESFDLERFDAGEKGFDINTLKRAIQTPPMASRKRLIILAQVEKLSESDRSKLLSILKSPVDSSILIMVTSPSAKTKGAFFAKIRSVSRSENFGKLKTYALGRWINDYVEERGYSIEKNGVLSIIEFAGENQISLSGEIEKMITYVGKRGTLKREDILNVLTSNKVKTIFDLTDAIGRREQKNALLILHYLLEWGEIPGKIFAMLRKLFLRLNRMCYYKKRGLLYEDIVKKMGVHNFIVSKEMAFLKGFSQNELKERLNLIYNAEARMKVGGDVNLILTDLVFNLI